MRRRWMPSSRIHVRCPTSVLRWPAPRWPKRRPPHQAASSSIRTPAFLIAALISERATGKHFEDLMQDEVFRPLGMTSAAFGPVPDYGIRGHRAGKPVGAMLKSADGVPMVYSSAGNVHMSLQDWARFCLDQLAGSRGEGALLSPA